MMPTGKVARGELAAHDGLGFIVNVICNGIMDDWEIFAHWGQRGYVVAPE